MKQQAAATENAWADPEGEQTSPTPIRYRIRDAGGDIVTRETEPAWDVLRHRYYHALHPDDQHFADAIVALVQRACAYFYMPDPAYEPLEGVLDVVLTDSEVTRRIDRLDRGENTREAERTRLRRYPLAELPFEQQRALIERIEALKRDWAFELLGPA